MHASKIATSTAARRLDCSDVDVFHLHHRIERALGGSGIGIGDRFRQGDRRNLPGQSPFVLAPAARALLAAVADDRVPVAIRFGLVSGCGTPITVNSTVNTSPFFPDGKSPGARSTAPTDES